MWQKEGRKSRPSQAREGEQAAFFEPYKAVCVCVSVHARNVTSNKLKSWFLSLSTKCLPKKQSHLTRQDNWTRNQPFLLHWRKGCCKCLQSAVGKMHRITLKFRSFLYMKPLMINLDFLHFPLGSNEFNSHWIPGLPAIGYIGKSLHRRRPVSYHTHDIQEKTRWVIRW